MKRIAALILALLTLTVAFAGCVQPKTPEPDENGGQTERQASSPSTAEPVEEEPAKYEFGVYNILTAEGDHKLSLDNTNAVVLDFRKEEKARFTLQTKTVTENGVPKKYYAIYIGDDTSKALGIDSMLVEDGEQGKIKIAGQGYNVTEKFLWTIEEIGDDVCRIVPKAGLKKRPICLAASDGKAYLANRNDDDPAQRFKIVKAPAHSTYVEFRSAKGNFITRVNKSLLAKSTGVTEEILQNWTDYMQEAYEKEIELTGFIPYDIIILSAWEDLNLAAGVADGYNVITAGKNFAGSEFMNMAKRNKDKKLNMIDMSFGFLHELGHMFDSNRGWNFESEAWTDLKLCYVIYQMTLDHKETDGLVFGCASADYPASRCFDYEHMAEALDIHAKKGAMTTVYGFFGAARLFLLMAYDFGWEPFVKTFHWYQDNGYTAASFGRWERFTTFVDKLSEYSGKDIRNDYLTEENWEVFRRYYQGETTTAV